MPGSGTSVLPTLGRPAARGRDRRRRLLKQLVAVVVVLNVSLGMAFSVIGLRHQADERARVQQQLVSDMANAQGLSAQLWQSVQLGKATPLLDGARLGADQFAPAVLDGEPVDPGLDAIARRYVEDATAVRAALGQGDDRAAARSAAAAQTRLVALLADLRALADSHARSSDRASTTADVETILLIGFAAVMGLLLFRRAVAATVAGNVRVARAHERAEARFGALVRESSDLISILSADGTVTYQSPSVEKVLGYPADQLVGTPLSSLLHPEDQALATSTLAGLGSAGSTPSRTLRWRHHDGSWRHMDCVYADMTDTAVVGGIVVTSRDVSDRTHLQQQLEHNAFHDSLTGLANRALFSDRVQHALSRDGAGRSPAAVIFLDLDDFKSVNDTLGHPAGDELLRVVARRLLTCTGHADTVARLGGDEFAILLEDRTTEDCQTVITAILDALREPVPVAGRQLSVRASLGLASAETAADSSALLGNADMAMYAAKSQGKDRFARFTRGMGKQLAERLQLRSQLQDAMDSHQLRVHFQPTVVLSTGELAGFEALVRWHHPMRGMVPPAEFIPLAEQSGLIVRLDRFVLHQACQALARWQQQFPGNDHLTMSVNVSARGLEEPDLVPVVRRELTEAGIEPANLTLEITESQLVRDQDRAIAQLTSLRAAGIRLAIDDFGTGYSSLSYLEQLPVDIVKIDKTFIDRLDGQQSSMIVETITQLSQGLGLQTVAEGIEQSDQAAALRGMSCDIGQGFLFHHPITEPEVQLLLRGQARARDTDLVPAQRVQSTDDELQPG